MRLEKINSAYKKDQKDEVVRNKVGRIRRTAGMKTRTVRSATKGGIDRKVRTRIERGKG